MKNTHEDVNRRIRKIHDEIYASKQKGKTRLRESDVFVEEVNQELMKSRQILKNHRKRGASKKSKPGSKVKKLVKMKTLQSRQRIEHKGNVERKKKGDRKRRDKSKSRNQKKTSIRKKNMKNKRMSMAPNFKFGGQHQGQLLDPRISLELGINFGKGDQVLVISDRKPEPKRPMVGLAGLERGLLSKDASKQSMALGSCKRSKGKNSKKRKKELSKLTLEEKEIRDEGSSIKMRGSQVKGDSNSEVVLPILQKSLRRMKKIGSKKNRVSHNVKDLSPDESKKSSFAEYHIPKNKRKKTANFTVPAQSTPVSNNNSRNRPRKTSGPGKMVRARFSNEQIDFGPASVHIPNNNYDSWKNENQGFGFAKKSDVIFENSDFEAQQFASHRLSIRDQIGIPAMLKVNSEVVRVRESIDKPFTNTNLKTGYDSFGQSFKVAGMEEEIRNNLMESGRVRANTGDQGVKNMLMHSFGNLSSQKKMEKKEMLNYIFKNYEAFQNDLQSMVRNKTLTDLSATNSRLGHQTDTSFEQNMENSQHVLISVENDAYLSSSKTKCFNGISIFII